MRDRDSGWAWVVLGAAYLNLLIGPGLAFVGGLFQTCFLEHFEESVSLTSWVTSLFASLLQLAGPLSGLVSSQVSCRAAVISGGILLSIGLAVSSLLNSIWLLLIFMGVVAGTGLGLTYSASVVVVNLYFSKRRTFVTGLALSASGLGFLIFPLICRHLLDQYSWRETLIVLAGISLQMVVCGVLMFPIHEKKKTCSCFLKVSKLSSNSSNYTARYDPVTTREGEEVFETHCHELNVIPSESADTDGDKNNRSSNTKLEATRKPLFRNNSFLLLCLSLFLSNSATGTFLIHLPSFCVSTRSSTSNVSFAMAMNGPALTASRILIGALGNGEQIDSLPVYVGLLSVGSIIMLVTPLFVTFHLQMMAFIMTGIYTGGSYSFLTKLTIEYVGLEHLTSAFGWEMIAAGSGYLVAPPIAGWLVDSTGHYKYSFMFSGGIHILSVCVTLLVPVWGHRLRVPPPQDQTYEVPEKQETE